MRCGRRRGWRACSATIRRRKEEGEAERCREEEGRGQEGRRLRARREAQWLRGEVRVDPGRGRAARRPRTGAGQSRAPRAGRGPCRRPEKRVSSTLGPSVEEPGRTRGHSRTFLNPWSSSMRAVDGDGQNVKSQPPCRARCRLHMMGVSHEKPKRVAYLYKDARQRGLDEREGEIEDRHAHGEVRVVRGEERRVREVVLDGRDRSAGLGRQLLVHRHVEL